MMPKLAKPHNTWRRALHRWPSSGKAVLGGAACYKTSCTLVHISTPRPSRPLADCDCWEKRKRAKKKERGWIERTISFWFNLFVLTPRTPQQEEWYSVWMSCWGSDLDGWCPDMSLVPENKTLGIKKMLTFKVKGEFKTCIWARKTEIFYPFAFNSNSYYRCITLWVSGVE